MKKTLKKFLHIAFSLTLILSNAFITNINASTVSDGDIITLTDPNFNKSNGYNTNIEKYMTIEVAEINENQSNIILSINRENGILAYTPYNRSTKTYGETVEFSNTSLNVERKVYSRTNLEVDHKAGTYKYTPDQNRTGNIYNGKFRYDGSNIAYTYGKGFAGIPKFVNVTAKFMSDGKEIKPAVTQKGIQSQSYIFLENYPIEGYSQTTVSGVKSGKVGKSDITVIYNYVEDYDAAKHDIVIDPASSGDTKIIGTGFPGDTIVFTDSSGEKIGEGVVDSNGDYDITLDRPLIGDEIITGQPITNGIKGNKENVVVYNREKHKVTIEQPVENDIIVKGKGIAGDLLILKDGNGINIGETTVNDDGSYTINVSRPLIGNEEIKVIPYTNDIEGMETKSTVLDKDAHKPTVNKPGSGETNVTGKGTPGDEIIITDGKGKEIGKGTVDSEGNFDVKTDRPLEPNEVITITPQTDGKAGTPAEETVLDKDAHKPTVNKPGSGETNVTGKGTPGDEIIITDGKGKEIGKGTVDSEGNFDVKTDRPLEPNEVITITPQTDGKAGTPAEETVLDKDAHKPTVNKPGSGETNVTGKGTPGDEIIITDGKGKEIGKGTVDSEGNFDVKTDRPLEPNEVITITPQTDGKAGTPTEETVLDKDAHKPTVNKPGSGETNVTGKGTPGDEIIITDGKGKEIGKGTVDSEGNFDVKTDRPLEPNEVITITPQTDGKAGTPAEETVLDKDAHKPTANKPGSGETNVTGKGTPGDEIIITDGKGKEIGKGTVDSEGNFDVKTDRPLEPNEVITITPQTDGKAGTPAEETVLDKDAHKPTVNKPGSGETNVTGKGTPGDEIIITDGKGKEIGKGTVDSEGNFDVKTDRPLEPNEVITITPQTDGKAGTPAEETVLDKDAHKPTVNKPGSGETNVTGKGTPGDEIIITDGKGKEIGKGTVDSEGNFDVKTDRPLEPNEVITITPQTDGKAGTPTEETVLDKDAHKPTVNKPGSGETNVTGKGTPGDEIIITDGKGKEIGKGTVDSEGNFDVKTDRPLEPNEVITITPQTDGKAGTSTKETVFDKDAHKPTVDKPTTGDSNLTGKGTPGDEIIITDGNGKEIGKGTVDSEGNFDVKTDRPLEPNEVITITPKTDGKAGTSTKETVFDKDAHKPTVDKPTTGDSNLTGKGTPGDEIIITDGNGKEIGKGTVDSEGNFDVKTDRPLEPNEVITITPQTDGKAGTPTEETVLDKDAHKPTVNKPGSGETNVTGKGTPGDEIIITDGNGKEIGKGTVDSEGNFDVKTDRPLEPNEVITITPQTDGKAGTPTEETVLDKDAHKPTVNKPGSGETNVTGKGTPGDEIIITDGKGKEIGKGTVDSEGNFDVKTDRPLEPNEVITITPQTDGKAGTPAEETVLDKDAHKPTVNKPGSGETNVTGKGTPGDEIIITDGKGKEIGKGTVDSEGNFDVKTDRPLEPNEVITITPQTDGKAGTPTEETVLDKDAHKPTVNKPGSGETNVTGKGTPGDEIIITDGKGKEIGKGTVDSEGNFDVKTDRPLEPNEVITITPKTDGKAGTSTKETVFDKDAHKPTVDKPTTGDSNLTGKGTPGDEIIITDGKGKEIGKGTVDSEGNFDVKTDRPLEPNEVITITPQTDGKAGTPTSLKVFDKYSHKPDLNPMKDGDELVSGTGVAGDVVIIIDSKGNEIGKGRVNILGKFSIKLNRKLSGGEEISAIPYTDGMRGTMITKSVMHQSDSKNVLPPAGISNNYSFLLLGVLQIVFGIKIYLKRMCEKEL